jgi:pentapeptide repeat protein
VTDDRRRLGGRPGDEAITYRVLSVRAIVAWAVVIVLAGVGVAVWLLVAYTGGDDSANGLRLDAIRTAGTVVVGAGGGAALLLAARRQRSTEIALRQKDREQIDTARAQSAAEADARERRITDLYTKAVEQLGSEKAPVRLGGMYALERLAQDNEPQRQTIVNVLCAYLRMPADVEDDPHEREVRVAAQRILSAHLRPGADPDDPDETFWPDIAIDLTNATLIDFDMSDCQVRTARFAHSRFTGYAVFDGARFGGLASFRFARFGGPAWFRVARFRHEAWFSGAQFADYATFRDARFEVEFSGGVRFDGVTFAKSVPDGIRQFWSPRPEEVSEP